MARNVLDLSDVCVAVRSGPAPALFRQPRDDRTAVTEWLPARVPGDVRADLLAAGQRPVARHAGRISPHRSGWTTPTGGIGPRSMPAEPGTTAVLEADGIDYLSSVWLDGQLLATHQGMFARQSIVLPAQDAAARQARAGGANLGRGRAAAARPIRSAAHGGLRRLLCKPGVSSPSTSPTAWRLPRRSSASGGISRRAC